MRPGDKLTEKTRGGATRTKKVPKDFIKHHNIISTNATMVVGAACNCSIAAVERALQAVLLQVGQLLLAASLGFLDPVRLLLHQESADCFDLC